MFNKSVFVGVFSLALILQGCQKEESTRLFVMANLSDDRLTEQSKEVMHQVDRKLWRSPSDHFEVITVNLAAEDKVKLITTGAPNRTRSYYSKVLDGMPPTPASSSALVSGLARTVDTIDQSTTKVASIIVFDGTITDEQMPYLKDVVNRLAEKQDRLTGICVLGVTSGYEIAPLLAPMRQKVRFNDLTFCGIDE
jgi:hypothetical protein